MRLLLLQLTGGFAGGALAETIRWGFARGLYSNEAGMGTAPIAHAAAMTDHPVRQGFWSVIGIVIDTLIICTTTAFVVLASGVWTGKDASNDPAKIDYGRISALFRSWRRVLRFDFSRLFCCLDHYGCHILRRKTS